MKRIISLMMTTVLMFSTILSTGVLASEGDTLETSSTIGVEYITHIEDQGWETDWNEDGQLSGTVGKWKRLEALRVRLTGSYPSDATIETYVHVQNKGNLGPFEMGEDAGTSGEGLRMESIKLVMENVDDYTLVYNVQVQNLGWLRDENDTSTWFQSGEYAGTSEMGLRLEAIRIELIQVNEVYAAYEDAIDNVEEDDYTIDSWTTYQKVVTAYAVTEDDDDDVIEEATEAILTAQKKLVTGMNLKKYKQALAQVSEENYTPESWEVYEEVVDENYVSQANTQTEIDEATANILEAQELLEGKVNLTEYNELLDSLRESDYTALTWYMYQIALSNNAVSAQNTQTEIDEAVANIEAAQKKLVRKFDFSAYNDLIDAVEEDDYTTISWAIYQSVIDDYDVSENSKQSEVEEAILAIEAAQADLVEGADLSGYYAVLDLVDQDSCTSDSWTTYQKVVLKNVVTKDSTQDDVDKATEKILEAQLKLVGLGDLTEYYEALAAVDEDDYTTKSWATYQKVVVKNVVTAASSQADIDSAVQKIQEAQLSLVLKGDLTEYNALLAAVSEDDYTSASWATYQKIVKSNYRTTDNSQAEIKTAILKIQQAQTNLVLKGDISEFEELIDSVSEDDYTADSWATYMKVVKKNYVTEDNSQTEIDAAVLAVKLAQMSLVESGDLSEYEELIEAYAGLEDDYTTTSWAYYQKVLSANEMTSDNTEAEIQLAVQRIKAAQAKLVAAADLTYYNEEIAKYSGQSSLYTSESWATYQAVLMENLVTKDNTQAEVNTATNNIYKAGLNLVYATDLTDFLAALDLYIEELQDGDVADLCTEASWDLYETRVTAYADFDANGDWVNTGTVNESTSQSAIDIATTYIAEARNALEPAEDSELADAYEDYLAAIELPTGMSEEDYTTTSYSGFTTVIEKYELETPIILNSVSTVETATAAINTLKAQLELIASDTSWNLFLAEAETCQGIWNDGVNSYYTDTTWKTFKLLYVDYVDDTRSALVQTDTTTEEADAATKALRDARIALQLSDPNADTVAALLTAEALQVEAYRDGDTYYEGVETTTDLKGLAETWLSKYSGYAISFTPGTNVSSGGVVTGTTGNSATFTFTITSSGTGATTSAEYSVSIPIITIS